MRSLRSLLTDNLPAIHADGRRTLATLAVLSAMPALAACGGEASVDDANGVDRQASVEEILDTRGKYLGETVTVSGRVGDVPHPRILTITEADEPTGEGLVVVSGEPFPEVPGQPSLGALEGQAVRVTGTVRNMDVIEREASPRVDIPDVLREKFPDQPAIVAQSVTLPAAEHRRREIGATVEEIAGGGRTYAGQLVTVNGEVSELVDDAAFVLEDKLLVVPAPAARLQGLEEGSNVRVTGPVREFDITDFDRRFGVDLAEDKLERYEGRPAVVATVASYAG